MMKCVRGTNKRNSPFAFVRHHDRGPCRERLRVCCQRLEGGEERVTFVRKGFARNGIMVRRGRSEDEDAYPGCVCVVVLTLQFRLQCRHIRTKRETRRIDDEKRRGGEFCVLQIKQAVAGP